MKSISLLVMGLFFVGSTIAQSDPSTLKKTPIHTSTPLTNTTLNVQPLGTDPGTMNHSCGSHSLNEQHYSDRGILNEYNLSYQQSTSHVVVPPIAKTPGVNTISVIFHVVHNPNNPAENVSNAAIMAVFNEIQQDFSQSNPDIGGARTGLGFNPADANINFCLATQTPTGVPLAEPGVVRVSTTEDWYNSNGGEENKMKSAATGGSTIWNRNNYLNIWICDISNGASSGTAGYAYRPTTSFLPGSTIDGIVIDYNLGVNNEHVTSHEIGHYLGLDHTWGGSGGCGNDDGFADTPSTAGPSFNYAGSCSGSQSTCSGIQTQYENFMDYANCTCMFTQDQADYMLVILNGIRSSLLSSPGCDPVNAPPVVNFIADIADPIVIPVGGSVNFTDQSTNAPTSWLWNFGGGAANSTAQNPSITFNTPGTYDVTLDATNAYGTGTLTKTAHVQVVTPATGTACDTLRNWDPSQSFTYYNVPPTNGAWGYIPGHGHLDLYGNGSSVEDVLQLVEQFSYAGVAEVRRVRLPIFIVQDVAPVGGSVQFKVYDDDNGANPGTVLASETVLLSDLTANAYNEIDFSTPASVSGTFFVGVELQYGAAQDTVLFGLTNTASGATPSFFMEMETYGWLNSGLLGLTESIVMDVMLSNGASPVADVTLSDTLVCVGGDIIANGSNSTNTTNYFWYQTDNPITTIINTSNSSAPTFNFPTAGNYGLILFADGSCQTDTYVQEITVAPAVAATVTPTATTCGNNNGQITITSPTGGNTPNYEYSLDGVNYTSTTTYSNLPSGNYTVYVRTGEDNCETTYPVTVGASTPFAATISPNTSICSGASATITAGGGVSYQWYDGATTLGTTPSISVSPASTTQFECVVTDGSGCQSTVYTTVNVSAVPAAPTITPSGSTTICSGSSLDLTSSSAVNNTWNTAETDQTITVNSSGTYSVTYTNAQGCVSAQASIVVTVNPTPTIAAGTVVNPTTCSTTTGSIQVTGSGTGVVSWTGTATGTSGSVTLPFTIPSLAAGSYNITFVDATGCTSNTLNQALTDPTPPATPTITPSGPLTFCAGGSVTLTSSETSGNLWSNGASTNSIVVNTGGTYSVTYTNGSGCSASSSAVVVVVNNNPATPTVTPSGSTTFCDGGSVVLTSSQSNNNVWSNAATTNAITVSTGGNYSVTYTNANGCSSTSAPVTVTVNSLPATPAISANGPVTFCEGGSVDLTSDATSGNTWSNAATTQSITVNTAGTYTVSVTDGNGCSSGTSNSITVTVNTNPTVSAGVDQTVCEGESVTLTASGASTYVWDNSVVDGVAFTPSSGTTTYTVVGTDANGCSNSSSVDVTANALPTVAVGNFPVICINHPNYVLVEGTPAGGTYSGTGITAGSFDPATGIGTYTVTYEYTDGNGCSNTATNDLTVDGCAGIEDQAKLDLLVFPNPTKEAFTISLDGDFTYTITDMQGKVIAKDKGHNSVQVNTSTFSDGVYFLEVATAATTEVIKITKQD